MPARAAFLAALAMLAGCGEEAKRPAPAASASASAASHAAKVAQAEPKAAEGMDWSRFVPQGWKIDASATGKLSEAEGDAVLVLRGTDPAMITKNDGLGEALLDLNPRKLVFLHKAGGQWQQAGEYAGLIPPAGSIDAPCLADPLGEGGIAIEKGVLLIRLGYWLSCGSYGVTNETFRFRLIGKDHFEFSRSTHEEWSVSNNYLTGRRMENRRAGDTDEDGEARRVEGPVFRGPYYLDEMTPERCDKAGVRDLPWCE